MFALVIFILSFVLQLFLPWWSSAILCFVIGAYFSGKLKKAFLSGFLGLGALWLLVALYAQIQNQNILAAQLAILFSLPSGWFLPFISGLLGGLIGGLSILSGKWIGQLRQS